MKKLYPPYIEGKLPAQCGGSLTIPFEYNRATGEDAVKEVLLKARIKTVATDKEIGIISTTNINNAIAEFSQENNMTVFAKLGIGDFYKIQLFWDESPYYSTVGVFKYTSEPELFNEYDNKIFPKFSYKPTDSTEPLLSYTYEIEYQINEKVVKYRKEDIPAYGITEFEINLGEVPFASTLKSNIEYSCSIYIEYISLNGLKSETELDDIYTVLEKNEEDIITTEQIADPGFNSIIINKPALLLRKRLRTDITSPWEILLTDIQAGTQCIDKNIEHGARYLYQVIYTDNTYDKWAPGPIYFEHMYLSDAHNVYCLQFNPKVSSFKTTVVESKQNTMGSQYPVFFRNANVNYKEFSLSALISFLMNPKDDEKVALFSSDWWRLIDKDSKYLYARSNLSVDSARITDLTDANIYHERQFRLKLLDWLNNGQPKFFRSPTEGNYIIRLTNISMAPNDTVGRMLYTVNASASEIAEVTQENLIKYNLI